MKNGGEQKSSARRRPARFPYWYVTGVRKKYVYTFNLMSLSRISFKMAHESPSGCVRQLECHLPYMQCELSLLFLGCQDTVASLKYVNSIYKVFGFVAFGGTSKAASLVHIHV